MIFFPGDINSLDLPGGQLAYASLLLQTNKPIILILVEGRPRLLYNIAEQSKAVLLAATPGWYINVYVDKFRSNVANVSLSYICKVPWVDRRSLKCLWVQWYHLPGFLTPILSMLEILLTHIIGSQEICALTLVILSIMFLVRYFRHSFHLFYPEFMCIYMYIFYHRLSGPLGEGWVTPTSHTMSWLFPLIVWLN